MTSRLHLLPAALSIGIIAVGSAACSSTGAHTGFTPGSTPSETLAPSGVESADAAQARGDYLYAARVYQEAANTGSPSQAVELRIRAAEAAASGNDFNLAESLIQQISSQPLSPDQQLRSRLVGARLALARNDTSAALRLLPVDPGNSPFAERVLLIRARALYRAGDPVTATQTLVQRERYLRDAAAINGNHEAIWAGLASSSLDVATLARAGSADPTTRGWIELANLARRNAPLEFYNNWRQRYPGHPGEERLADLFAPGAGSSPGLAASPPATNAPSPIYSQSLPAGNGPTVLLLPQTGPLAGIGEAVNGGYAAAAARAGSPAAQTIDLPGGAALLGNAAQQASAAGAGLVIGPLLRDDVIAMSQLGAPGAPVLALNYLDVSHPAPPGFYQFGLAPEDEARAAAEDAVGRGLRRALVLVQNGEWGARVAAAFQQRLTELGGRVVDSDTYGGEQESWSDPVKRLMHYRPIDDKKKAAEARAKVAPGIDPQRRNDIDFIFLGARTADHARLLWPLFRFYHGERLAIYATASINSGPGDRDLAGIRFCDAPWLLDSSGTWSAFHDQALNGRSPDGARLFALGADSFTLAQRLRQTGLHAGDEIPGATGVLRVGADGAVHRGLICAQMSIGPPAHLPPAGTGDVVPDATAPL